MPDIFINPEETKDGEQKFSKTIDAEVAPTDPVEAEEELTARSSIEMKERLLSANGGNPISSFCYFPKGIDFETKTDKEKVILLLRRHPITNIPWMITAVVMAFGPSFLSILPVFETIPVNVRFVGLLFWYLVTVAFALEQFLDWFFNVNIITNERIVDIDFFNLIYKEVSDAEINRIQDVTYQMGGVLRTLVNYGDVVIQTAGDKTNIEFLAVPKPDEVVTVINELIQKTNDEQGVKEV